MYIIKIEGTNEYHPVLIILNHLGEKSREIIDIKIVSL
jgi:hypothetical protein